MISNTNMINSNKTMSQGKPIPHQIKKSTNVIAGNEASPMTKFDDTAREEIKFTLTDTLNYVLIQIFAAYMDGKNLFKKLSRDLYIFRISIYAIIVLVVVYMILNIYKIVASFFKPTCKYVPNGSNGSNVYNNSNVTSSATSTPTQPTRNHATNERSPHVFNTPSEPSGANGVIIEKYSAFEDPTDSVETYDKNALFKNLNTVNATLYVADNCKYCTQQAEILGETKESLSTKIKMVNCVKDGVFLDHCKHKELQGFPTWECGGNMYTGSQTIQELNTIVMQNS